MFFYCEVIVLVLVLQKTLQHVSVVSAHFV